MSIEKFNTNIFTKICYNICSENEKHLYKDLHQECLLIILEKNLNINNIIDEQLPYFFAKVAFLTYNSAKFRKDFRTKGYKPIYKIELTTDIVDEVEDIKPKEKGLEAIELELFNVTQNVDDEYKRTLFNCYLKYGTGYAVSSMTGIPIRTVYRDLNDYKETLKSKYNEATDQD